MIAELLASPHFLLHCIDPARGTATFIPTTAARLTQPSFIDGRSDFSTSDPVVVALDAVLASPLPSTPGPNRMIFHVAFCGSTLLARMLEHDGVTHVLKEPNVLVDLANWKRAGVDARFTPALQLAMACLRRRWSTDEVVIIKPSNWVNNLLVDLAGDTAALRPLFITMDPRAYAVAVLRGGRDRLTFAARTAAHLAPYVPDGLSWMASAIAATADPIPRAINLSLVALHLQRILFDQASGTSLTAAQIVSRPAEAAHRASALLGLNLDPARIDAIARERSAINAKRPGHAFSSGERGREDDEVERHHGPAINAALAWADRTLN